MFIITAENHAAQFVLRDGAIVGLTYRLLRGSAALPLLRTFPAGRYRFQTETVDHTDPELPATADLLALLIPEPAVAVGPPQAEPATDTPQVPEAVRLLIERELAEVLGPIAGLICQEHFAHAGRLDSPNDLARLLEAIAIEIGDPTKAADFKHQVLSKFNQSQDAQWTAGGGADAGLGPQPSTLLTCEVQQLVTQGSYDPSCSSMSALQQGHYQYTMFDATGSCGSDMTNAGWCYVQGKAAGQCSQAILFSIAGNPTVGASISLECIETASAGGGGDGGGGGGG